MSLVIYADFNCPWSYLASRRIDALAAAGVEADWRAVEADPRLPVTGQRLTADGRAALQQELSAVAGLLLPGEELPSRLPDLIPKTEAAVSGYAEAYGAGVGADVRRLLFAAYWLEGADIGDPNVLRTRLAGPILRGHSTADPLREAGFAVSVNRGPITTSAWRRVRAWRDEWNRLGRPALPVLLADGEPPASGEESLRRLEKELARLGAPLNPELPDPARYPAPTVRPAREWVSRVGGPWAYAWMG
ncbi:MAG TPA: DsbA family protein [Micromonosporaceae bacterium]|nr:DsbA family protein [Micromonosporaceae bacterium]